jgi:hypothetical protein
MGIMSEETQDTEATQVEDAQLEIDPKALEAQMIAAAQARAEDPIETASQAYGMYVPHFKRAIPKLSTRGLRRLVNYLVLYPLEQEDFRAANDFEKQVMQLAGQLSEAKFVMIMATYQENAQKLYDAEQSKLTDTEKAEVVETLRAGGVSEEEIERLNKENT